MKMMTSAYANKLIKSLSEEKSYWTSLESVRCLYTASVDEEPVIPEYDYASVAATIAEIDDKVCAIKHAINLANSTAEIEVDGEMLSVDVILIKMAQLNSRKAFLDNLRKRQPQSRCDSGYRYSSTRKPVVEYTYINYDLDLVKEEFEKVSDRLMRLQIALDKYNQTYEFPVEV
ncbi:MAG: hypothetical protein MJ094_01145 [Saccharofermentans sp.]|nr:hypothetical protein [Saccharofermentans sp.]